MENIQKALRVLRLPDSAAIFNGLVTDKTSRIIVQKRTHDFTKLVKGKPTITDVYEIVESTVPFTVYSFNFLNFYLHGYNHDLINEDPSNYVFEKPMTIGTPTLGAFAGYTYWYPGSFCKITPSSTGFDFDVKLSLGMNTTTTGLPEPTGGTNPKITITCLEYVKTKTKTTGPSKSYPAYTKSDLLASMNLSEDQLMESLRTTYKIGAVDSNSRITSTGADVEYTVAENGTITAKGIVYFNGIPSTEIEEGQLITSYGKTHPGFVVRWRLYNGESTSVAYGSTWLKQLLSSEDTTINIVAGDKVSFNEVTKTLTYNKNLPADIWFTFEELPAQGKNWVGESIYELDAFAGLIIQ